MLLHQVRETIQRFDLIPKDSTILIGISGGPDSLCLLYLLAALRKEYRLCLHAAHIDHMLRKQSSQDAQFVKHICTKLNIPAHIYKVDISKIQQKNNGSIEEISRNARLGFLLKTAKNIKARTIALGHNLDDQAETVLMRLLRGSGLSGLAAISPKRKVSGVTIIRPLINTKRKDIETFLKLKKLKPRIDHTNKLDIYLRNRIRHQLIPLLEKNYNKNIKEVLSHTAQSIAEDYDLINQLAQNAFKATGTNIPLARYNKLHPALQRMVLRMAITKLTGNTRRIDFRHIAEIQDLIANRPVNSIVHLPKAIEVVKKPKTLAFTLG